jgi:hypothetical protein
MFFQEATPEAISSCVRSFIAQENGFSRASCRAQALQFSAERFRREFVSSVNRSVERHQQGVDPSLLPTASSRFTA